MIIMQVSVLIELNWNYNWNWAWQKYDDLSIQIVVNLRVEVLINICSYKRKRKISLYKIVLISQWCQFSLNKLGISWDKLFP